MRKQLLSIALLAIAWMTNSSAWAHDGDHNYVNGICTIKDCTDKYQAPELDPEDNYYMLANAGNIEWLAAKITPDPTSTVPAGLPNEGQAYTNLKYKLTADIDYKGITHALISGDAQRFQGTFDGQYHVIKNLVMEGVEKASFFGRIRGGSIIKNIIFDKSCLFHGTYRAAAVAEFSEAGAGVTMQNIINFATITAEGNAASAFLVQNSNCTSLNYANCVNAGNVTAASSNFAAVLVAWNANVQTNARGCYNIGTISPMDGTLNLSRRGAPSLNNTFDLANTTAQGKKGNQGVKNDWKTADPLHSGELCFQMNKSLRDGEVSFKQDLSDPNSIPMPVAEGKEVYESAAYECDGVTLKGSVSYTNTEGGREVDAHVFDESGICVKCGGFAEPALVDGYYEITKAGELEWFAQQVNVKGTLQINAKLMNDIDMLGKENLHTPIGPNTSYKFNGVFDGQGHRIMNMIINRPDKDDQALFGYLRGNAQDTWIKNVIIDSSCSIKGRNNVAAIAANGQNNETVIHIENCVNEAAIEGQGNVASMVASSVNYTPKWHIKNCVNTGSIKGASWVCSASGWFGNNGNAKIENFLNIGEVIAETYYDKNNISRIQNADNMINCIDLKAYEGGIQGIVEGLTDEDVENGKIASMMGFKQLIGTDAYPSPLNEAEVYAVGEAGYATMVAAEDTKLNGDAQAYIVKTNGATATLTEVADVPAGQAVVLKGTYYNKVACTATADCTGNELKAATEDVEADGSQYVLANKNDVIGFYKANSGTIKAGKAYLENTADVKAFFFGDNATGIEMTTDNGQQTTEIFNLSGQRMNKMQKGINIVGGKKVLF